MVRSTVVGSMLGCIACSKRLNGGSLDAMDDEGPGTPRSPASKEAIKNLTSQLKDMASKFSGSYRYCKPGTPSNLSRGRFMASEAGSQGGTPRGISFSSTPTWNMSNTNKGHVVHDGDASRIGTPKYDNSFGPVEPTKEEEEEELCKEWISQVEPGVLITLVSLKGGGNDLKRIRFSRELFDKCQAQRWWAENNEKVLELYNVRPPAKEESTGFAKEESAGFPKSETEIERKMEESMGADSPVMPPPRKMSLFPRGLYADAARTSSSRDADGSEDLQNSEINSSSSSTNSSEQEQEWVEEDEPGIYITIHSSPSGKREVKRVRFSENCATTCQDISSGPLHMYSIRSTCFDSKGISFCFCRG